MLAARQRSCGPATSGSSQRVSTVLGSTAEATAEASRRSPDSSVDAGHAIAVHRHPGHRLAGADLGAGAGRGPGQGLGQGARPAGCEHRLAGRAAAPRSRAQHDRGRARRPRAHGGVPAAQRRQRPAHGVVGEPLAHEVGRGHGQRAGQLAAAALAQPPVGPAQPDAGAGVARAETIEPGRRHLRQFGHEPGQQADVGVVARIGLGVGRRHRRQPLRGARRVAPEGDRRCVLAQRQHAHGTGAAGAARGRPAPARRPARRAGRRRCPPGRPGCRPPARAAPARARPGPGGPAAPRTPARCGRRRRRSRRAGSRARRPPAAAALAQQFERRDAARRAHQAAARVGG